jgi:hypothetical protein
MNEEEEFEAYGDEDASYEMAGDEIQAEEAAELSHVKAGELSQIKYMNVVLAMECTPTEAQKTPSLCQASLAEHVQKGFHTINAASDRLNPAKEHLGGDLTKMVVVSLVATGYNNMFSHALETNVKGHVPVTLTQNGRCGMVMEPNTIQMGLNIDLHSPNDLMTRDMLEIYQKCDETILEREFQVFVHPETGKKTNIVWMDGAASRLVARNPKMYKGYRAETPYISNSACRFAFIPHGIGKKLYMNMKKKIESIQKAFVSASDIEATFTAPHRFDDVSRFIGDSVAMDSKDAIQHHAEVLSRKMRAAIHLRIGYTIASTVFPKTQEKLVPFE